MCYDQPCNRKRLSFEDIFSYLAYDKVGQELGVQFPVTDESSAKVRYSHCIALKRGQYRIPSEPARGQVFGSQSTYTMKVNSQTDLNTQLAGSWVFVLHRTHIQPASNTKPPRGWEFSKRIQKVKSQIYLNTPQVFVLLCTSTQPVSNTHKEGFCIKTASQNKCYFTETCQWRVHTYKPSHAQWYTQRKLL